MLVVRLPHSALADFIFWEYDVADKTLRKVLARALVATAFAALATTAQAVFVSGVFDPPDVSGTHTFDLEGPCLTGSGPRAVNDDTNCAVTLTRLTVLLDHSFPLNFSSFIPYTGIDSILVIGGQLAGVHTGLIGAATVSEGIYAGSWWIQYYYNFSTDFVFEDPVSLFHNCTDPSCIVDTALVVTFFPSDANGNPLPNGVPEPGSLLLIASALGAGWLARRRVAA